MNQVIADFFDGKLDSVSTHATLIGVIAVAEISLGIGIWLESPGNKTFREWLGLALVLGGCVFGVIFTVLLLIFDEAISRTQQSKIILLETKLVELKPRWDISVDDFKLFSKVLAENKEKIGPVTLYSLASRDDLEAARFGGLIFRAMENAGIDMLPEQISSEQINRGIVTVDGLEASLQSGLTLFAAKEGVFAGLSEALRKANIPGFSDIGGSMPSRRTLTRSYLLVLSKPTIFGQKVPDWAEVPMAHPR